MIPTPQVPEDIQDDESCPGCCWSRGIPQDNPVKSGDYCESCRPNICDSCGIIDCIGCCLRCKVSMINSEEKMFCDSCRCEIGGC